MYFVFPIETLTLQEQFDTTGYDKEILAFNIQLISFYILFPRKQHQIFLGHYPKDWCSKTIGQRAFQRIWLLLEYSALALPSGLAKLLHLKSCVWLHYRHLIALLYQKCFLALYFCVSFMVCTNELDRKVSQQCTLVSFVRYILVILSFGKQKMQSMVLKMC